MNRRIAIFAALGGVCLSFTASLVAQTPATPSAGSPVEVREGDSWSKATFVRREGRRLLVRYDDGPEEWITADRMRASSSDAAPKSAPGAAPADTAKAAPADSRPVTLDGPFIEVALDTAPAPRRVSAVSVKQTPTTRPANAFSRLGSGIPHIDKLLPCADGGNVLLGVTRRHLRDQTEVIRLDLDHADQPEIRSLAAPKHELLAAADGGKFLLTKPEGNAVTLHVWEYASDEYKLKANYTFISKKGGRRVETALMVSPTRVLVCSDSNENFLVDLTSRRAVCMFQSFGRKPELDPTGRLVLLFNNNTGGVLRASDCGVVAELPNCDAFQIPHVDPTATLAAYPCDGGVRIARLGTGTPVATIIGIPHGRENIHLLSADYVLVGDVLYEVKTGIPVWEYVVPPESIVEMLPSGQMLYVLRDSGTACLATIPDAKAVEALKAQRPEDYLLAPGAQIAIGTGLNLYGSDQKAAEDLVKKAVTSAGHKVAPGNTGYKLNFTSAPGQARDLYFDEHIPFASVARKVTAPTTVVTATLTRDGETIWQQTWVCGAGGVLMRRNNQTLEQAAAEDAQPKAGQLNSMALPAYIPKGSTPGEPATLGASTVSPDGFGPPPERNREEKPGAKPPGGIRKGPVLDEHSV